MKKFPKPCSSIPFELPLKTAQSFGAAAYPWGIEPSKIGKNKDVLLTGAGGFLGVHLIEELLKKKKSQVRTIYASVRSKARAEATAKKYGIDPRAWGERVVFVEGDLNVVDEQALPKVGMVIHGAAQVHALKDLRALWDDNVSSTERLLALYGSESFYFISSLSVFVSSNQTGLHKELSHAKLKKVTLYGGYAQSKAVCEEMVEKSGGAIFRLGLVTAPTQSAIPNEGFLKTFIDAVKGMGVYPLNFEEAWVDVSPVDLVCKEIVSALSESKRVKHIASKNAYPLSRIVKRLGIKGIDKIEWLHLMESRTSLEKTLLKMAFFKSEEVTTVKKTFNIDVFQSTGHQYDVAKRCLIDT